MAVAGLGCGADSDKDNVLPSLHAAFLAKSGNVISSASIYA